MVTNTPGFDNIENVLMGAGVAVWLLHMTLPSPSAKKPSSDATATVDRLEKLIQMRSAGHLTDAEFVTSKAQLLGLPTSVPIAEGAATKMMAQSGAYTAGTMCASSSSD